MVIQLDSEREARGKTRPYSRLSDDRNIPFICENCDIQYTDYPALIVVETINKETYRYCTDSCAIESGFSEAVRHRWDHEIRGEGLAIVFYP